jgi:hypothetical protein
MNRLQLRRLERLERIQADRRDRFDDSPPVAPADLVALASEPELRRRLSPISGLAGEPTGAEVEAVMACLFRLKTGREAPQFENGGT